MVSTIGKLFAPQNSVKPDGNRNINDIQDVSSTEESARLERINAIKEAIENKTYVIDLNATAEAMVRELKG
jgi:anti-sigma28 factor (negative regulator of flagellin synthesis)